jgi:hypothetical protein
MDWVETKGGVLLSSPNFEEKKVSYLQALGLMNQMSKYSRSALAPAPFTVMGSDFVLDLHDVYYTYNLWFAFTLRLELKTISQRPAESVFHLDVYSQGMDPHITGIPYNDLKVGRYTFKLVASDFFESRIIISVKQGGRSRHLSAIVGTETAGEPHNPPRNGLVIHGLDTTDYVPNALLWSPSTDEMNDCYRRLAKQYKREIRSSE